MNVKCTCCSASIDRSSTEACPLMFNLGSGPKYVCGQCYPTFDFTGALNQYFQQRVARIKDRVNSRHTHERAKGALYGKRREREGR